MNQKMNWKNLVKTYPDEWIALINYKQKGAVEIEGIVVAHGRNRKDFHQEVGKLLPKYGDIFIRHTGELIKSIETPLLWQISHTD